MAVLKIRSVVAVSEDHRISHLPLLHWKAKLKRIAEEGDDLLRTHKKQALECNSVSDSTPGNSISQYLIQAAKRFVPFCRKEDEFSDNTLRRFERLADGADSFFRLVESGGHPKKSVFLPSLTRSLLAGDSMEFSIQRRSGDDHIMLWPWLGPDIGSGLMACLSVSREDEVMWQKSFKMCVVFRLSEASNILAIAMSCLELILPLQLFDAARIAIRKLLTETIGQSDDRSNLSERSIWCCRRIQSYHRNDCEPFMGDKHRGTETFSLPHSVLRFTSFCYASPSICRKDDGLPIELECHVSPYLLPEKHSNQLELVEQDVVRKLLLKVTDGFYDDERQTLHCKRQIWCPQTSMYCSVAPVISQPLTMSQAYLMECSGNPSSSSRRRRRSAAKTKPQSIPKLHKIAKT
ncbi:hypothetical protein BAE44_0024471 [Dichanthelium oligosanthes]|uniref:Uncharacterized protein n=1 Tax=Dichanthelium oligosanthes TaxID=888268 RepID=A0A1E5UNQ0_9POAL|nr:hypothetical protein BAE44_0024471 [Dichanthelium oligosanthes]